MKSNRRKFLRNLSLGTGALSISLPSLAKVKKNEEERNELPDYGKQSFNMCGYAAPKLDKVRIGFVGLGMRGPGAVQRMSVIEGVEIKALCDKYPDRASKAQEILVKAGLPKAKEYSGEDGWKAMCESNEIDLVYNCTPWHLHGPISVYAMKNGKHAAS